jgi:protein disulfide-isomerase A1
LTEENISKFVKSNALPLIVDFNHETAQKVFGGEIFSKMSQQSDNNNEYGDQSSLSGKEGQKFRNKFNRIGEQFNPQTQNA